jgi:hypothetical protein
MLEVQKYLLAGKTYEDLNDELAIKATFHPTLPLVILGYSQIDSPKVNEIVRECRGLTLDSRDNSVVGLCMARFFNWGEVQEEQQLFDFSDFTVQEKCDGSLCTIFNFEGGWYANTRGSFGLDTVQGSQYTWQELFCKALGLKSLHELDLNKGLTYTCEFCSIYNKIVKTHPEPVMYLLTAFDNSTLQELDPVAVDQLALAARFKRPQRYDFKSIEEIQEFLRQCAETDPTYEGVVLCDKDFRRWKCKSLTYLALHHLRGEGDNLFHPKHLLPFILTGEEDELLLFYPETKEAYTEVKCKVLLAYINMLETWIEHKDIEEQRAFAQTIIGKTPFTSILFNVRKKQGKEQKLGDLKKEWREAESLILKAVFGK